MSSGERQLREPVRGRRGFLTLVVFLTVTSTGMPAGARTPGHLDPTFATGGLLVRDVPAFDSLAVQPDGRVLLSSPAGIERLDVTGATDPSSSGGSGVRGRLALQPDGRVVVLGRDGFDPDRTPRDQCGEVTFADAPDLPHCRTRRNGAGISCH